MVIVFNCLYQIYIEGKGQLSIVAQRAAGYGTAACYINNGLAALNDVYQAGSQFGRI